MTCTYHLPHLIEDAHLYDIKIWTDEDVPQSEDMWNPTFLKNPITYKNISYSFYQFFFRKTFINKLWDGISLEITKWTAIPQIKGNVRTLLFKYICVLFNVISVAYMLLMNKFILLNDGCVHDLSCKLIH